MELASSSRSMCRGLVIPSPTSGFLDLISFLAKSRRTSKPSSSVSEMVFRKSEPESKFRLSVATERQRDRCTLVMCVCWHKTPLVHIGESLLDGIETVVSLDGRKD